MEIAWIGTGIMGAPMVRRLLRAGHRVRVFNRSPQKARALATDGASVAAEIAEAARGAEAVFIMVPDTPDVEAVVAKLEPALARGQFVVDMSTIAPAAERTIAQRLAAKGVEYLDAPVCRRRDRRYRRHPHDHGGRDRRSIHARASIARIDGQAIAHMGGPGTGQTTKLANQIAVAVTLEAAAEALLFARQSGLDPAKVLEAIGAGAAGSWQLSNLGPKIIEGDFRPAFSSS